MSDEVSMCAEELSRVNMTIILEPELIEGLTREVVVEVEKMGLKAFVRAEGYAFMRSEVVGQLGLPHLRYAVAGDRAMVWVRAPYRLREDLLAAAGFSIGEYCREVLEAARRIASVFEKYGDRARGVLIELP